MPSGKKPREDLDDNYVLSPGHDEVPFQMTKRRRMVSLGFICYAVG